MEVVDHGNTYLGGCIIPGSGCRRRLCPAGPPSCRASSWTSPSGSLGRIPWSVCAVGSCMELPPCWTGCWTGWRRNWGKRTTVVGDRWDGAVHRPPVPAEDDGGKRPFAEGPVRHLQEKQEVTADHRRRRAEPGTEWVPASFCTGEQMHRLRQDKRRCVENLGQRGGEAFAEWTLLGMVRAKCLIPSGKCGKKSLLS